MSLSNESGARGEGREWGREHILNWNSETGQFPCLQLLSYQELMQYHVRTITEKFYAVFCQVFLYNSFITSLTAAIKIPAILYQQPSLY